MKMKNQTGCIKPNKSKTIWWSLFLLTIALFWCAFTFCMFLVLNGGTKTHWLQAPLHSNHLNFLVDNRELVTLIEPYLLKLSMYQKGLLQNKSIEQVDLNFQDLVWRFNLDEQHFSWNGKRLTVAMFDRFEESKLRLSQFVETHRVMGQAGPYGNSSTCPQVQHVFYEWQPSWFERLLPKKFVTFIPNLVLHLVVMFKATEEGKAFWISAMPNETLSSVPNNGDIYFGSYEQIYDPLIGNESCEVENIALPCDVEHFLSQLSTDRYIHCPVGRMKAWFSENPNVTISLPKVNAWKSSFENMKDLMRDMRMQFWIVCGTLLGWYRQCHPTPFTDDTDFATWSWYALHTANLTTDLQITGIWNGLILYSRFGEPSRTLEYSFMNRWPREKVDLFFVYPNLDSKNYLLPYHLPPYYAYSRYPRYELCSVLLLGYKLLAPCTPEEVIRAEYGSNWNVPISTWNYAISPNNSLPAEKWNFANVDQEEKFWDFYYKHAI